MTRSRTETNVDTATSVSATAVTTSITLALPDAIATVCASDLCPASATLLIASLSTALKDGPPASLPAPAPPSERRPRFADGPPDPPAPITRARLAYAFAAAIGEDM